MTLKFGSWAEVDLDAITGNVRALGAAAQTPVLAVVKANGYGHGAVSVARAALAGGATWLGVARVEEALQLRAEGITAPVLVMGWTPPGRLGEAIAAEISLAYFSAEHLAAIAEAAAAQGKKARLHLKVDTGMGRIGCRPDDALALLTKASTTPEVLNEGVFTHYACADEVEAASNVEQTAKFAALVAEASAAGVRPTLVHSANSAAALGIKRSRYDLVRFGIALYGLSPGAAVPLPAQVRPALTWKAVLTQVRRFPAGTGLSYGHTYVTDHDALVGALPVGYADGLRRTTGNQVLVGGVEVPIVGRVCMDQSLVLLDQVPDAAAGDEVVIIGSQSKRDGARVSTITADQVAQRWGTIGYEVTCGVSLRVPRLYQPADPA